MIDERKALHLAGETIREIGILLVVFAPLDAFLQKEAAPLPILGGIVTLALLLIVAGIRIEAGD